MKHSCFLAITVLVCSLLPALAQTSRGTVSGLVLDPQKASVPAATVELTNNDTNIFRSTTTNDAGLYRFDAVDPGSYRMVVKHAGFKNASAAQIDVRSAMVTTLDVVLEVGDVQQTIEISASIVALQTESPVRGGSVLAKDISELPSQSRNPANFALLVPGVVSSKYATPTNSFSVNGTRGRSNNFMIDGTDNNDISIAGQAFEVRNPGSIQEVSVQTTNYDSEFGRAGGAVVNLITKSGTNVIHGTAGFVLDSTRDDAISSTLAQDPAIAARGKNLPGTEQQFDGTLGGPVKHDKTFYHLSYLELRQFSTSTSEMVSPTATGRATLLRLFPRGANANADLLQDITKGYDGVFRLSNHVLGNGRPAIEFGRVQTAYPQEFRLRQYGTKIDHLFRDKDRLSGRFLIDDQLSPQGGETLSFPSFLTSQTVKTTSISLSETHIFSPTITNELRPGYTRFVLDVPLDPSNPLGFTIPQIAIAGINTLTSNVYGVRSQFPQGRTFNNYALQDTVSIIHGKHTFRFGFDLMSQRARQAAPFNARGQLSYVATGTEFSGLANFLDNFGGGGGGATRVFGQPFYYPDLFRQAYFFQERWRATSNLTVSIGARYEYFGTPMNVTLNPVFTGLFNVTSANGVLDSPLFKPNKVAADKNNWSPNIGLAYSPSFDRGLLGWLWGNHKSSFRMGYGLGYDAYFNNITSNIVASAPAAVSDTTSSTATTANPRGLPNLSSALPTRAPAVTPFLSQTAVSKDLVNPYYQRWSFSIQRELPAAILIDMAYVGTKGTKLFLSEDWNPLVTPDLYGPVTVNPLPAGTTLQNRLDRLQGSRLVRTNGGSSTYHGAQFELKRRFASGFSLNAAYTFSKAMDNGSEIFSYGNSSTLQNNVLPPVFGGLQIDRSVSFFDRTHRAVFSYNYELPFMKTQAGILGHAIGGWQIAGIATYESGTPFSVINGQDADGIGAATYDRPNLNPKGQAGVRAVPNASSPTGYVNPDNNNAPIDPNSARYIGIAGNTGTTRKPSGNAGRNTERGLGLKNWDVTIVKNTRITERMSIQFRAEFFNFFNTPMYGKVSVSPFAPQQGSQIIPANVFTSPAGQFLNKTIPDGGGRVIRWQLRLNF